MSISKSFVKF